jgi:hypothetical protein
MKKFQMTSLKGGIDKVAAVVLVAGLSSNQTTLELPRKHSKPPATKNRQVQPPSFDYRRGNSNWPYGAGHNFPYPDRPYGDPGHGGE